VSLLSNLQTRLGLIRLALTRRFIWDDLVAMVGEYGFEQRDVRGNAHPLRLAAGIDGAAGVDFSSLRAAGESFRRADAWKWNSEPSVSEFLGELAARRRPRAVVELGCYLGWTSAHLAQGLRVGGGESRLWCLDSNPGHLQSARENLVRLGLADRVEFVAGLSLAPAVLERLPAEIDLVFLDTSHGYEDTRGEISAYSRRLAAGGMLVLHDSISLPGVRRAVLEVWEQFETTTFATEFGNGLTVLRRPAAC
jgi:predicted O-methyltransferase YrrM